MNNNIWSPKGMPEHQACVKIPYKGYEISIAMDDSCGGMDTLRRSNIRVYREWDDADVTDQFWPVCNGVCTANADNLKDIFSQIDMFGDRD